MFLHCQLNHQYVAEGLALLAKPQQLGNLVAAWLVVATLAQRPTLLSDQLATPVVQTDQELEPPVKLVFQKLVKAFAPQLMVLVQQLEANAVLLHQLVDPTTGFEFD